MHTAGSVPGQTTTKCERIAATSRAAMALACLGPTVSFVVESKVAVSYFARLSRALRHRNYRLFFAGQSISLIGTWLTQVASSWLVYGLTKSALLLGVASFASQAPTFFLSPFVGVWVDR